jgi:hypothetical protein
MDLSPTMNLREFRCADPKTPEDKGDAQNADQRDLTTRVGTRLERTQKKGRRRLFGRRRTTPTTGS